MRVAFGLHVEFTLNSTIPRSSEVLVLSAVVLFGFALEHLSQMDLALCKYIFIINVSCYLG